MYWRGDVLERMEARVERRDELIVELLKRVDKLEKNRFRQEINPIPEKKVSIKTSRKGG